MKRSLYQIFILIFLVCFQLKAETRLALISSEGKNSHLLDLVVAEISKMPKIQVVERQQIRQIIKENEISLSDHSAVKILQASNLLKVDIFGILNDKTKGLIIFDARTGLRYSDTAIEKEDAVKQAAFIKGKVLASLSKSKALEKNKLKSISFLSVRNVNLKRSHDSEFNALAKAVERNLVNYDGIGILERTFLDKLNKEKFLPGEKFKAQLLKSMNVIDLMFEKDNEGQLFCHIYALKSKDKQKVASVKISEIKERATLIANALAGYLGEKKNNEVISLKSEAKRFYLESKFWHNLIELDKAVENAEAAYALAPENPKYLKHLSEFLFNLAEYKLGGYRFQGLEKLESTAEKLKTSLIIAERALALKDAYRSMVKAKADPYYCYEIYMFIGKPIVASGHNKETLELLHQFQRRWAKRLRKAYEYRREQAKKKPNRYIEGFFYDFPSRVYLTSSSEEQYAEKILRQMSEGLSLLPELKEKAQFEFIDRLYRSLSYVFSRKHKVNNKNRDRMVSLLKPLLKSEKWQLRETAMNSIHVCRHYRSDTPLESKKKALKSLIDFYKNKLKTAKRMEIRADIYSNLQDLSWQWYDWDGRIALCLEFAHLMIKNKEIEPHLMALFIYNPYTLAKKESRFLEIDKIVKESLSLIKDKKVITAKSTDKAYGINYLNELKLELAKKLKKRPSIELPWDEEKLIYDQGEFGGISHFVIRNDSLFFLENAGAYRIMKLDLKTLKLEKSKSFPLIKGEIYCAHLGDKHFYLGTSEGIYGLPLTGDEVIHIPTKDFPSQEIQSFGEINGNLYLGLGKKLKEGFLIKYNIAKKTSKLISSSYQKKGDSLFAHQTSHAYFSHMVKDWKRNQLLFYVEYDLNVNPSSKGLWSVSDKQELKQVAKLYNYPKTLNFSGEDDLIIADSWRTVAVNLQTNKTTLLQTMDAHKGHYFIGEKSATPAYQIKTNQRRGLLIKGNLLTELPFGIAKPGEALTLLPLPQNVADYKANNGFIKLPFLGLTPDKKSVIYILDSKIILLKLKENK